MVALLATSGRLFGQKDAVAEWDPQETGELALTWKTTLVGLLLALACCGLWKLLMWFLENRRGAVNWK